MVTKRSYRSIPLLLALAAAGTADAYAQQKIAYVASEAILEKLPDAQSARAKLTEIQKGWMREIQRQEQDISKIRTEIQTNRLLWSAQEKRDAEARLADMEAKLATYRAAKFGPSQEFDRQQSELMGPVIDKVSKAIDEEARAQKYDYVFDKSSRGMGVVYANPAHDLTWAVLKRLGVEVEAPPETGVSSETDAVREQDALRNRGRGRRGQQQPPSTDPNDVLTTPPSQPDASQPDGSTPSGGGDAPK